MLDTAFGVMNITAKAADGIEAATTAMQLLTITIYNSLTASGSRI